MDFLLFDFEVFAVFFHLVAALRRLLTVDATLLVPRGSSCCKMFDFSGFWGFLDFGLFGAFRRISDLEVAVFLQSFFLLAILVVIVFGKELICKK